MDNVGPGGAGIIANVKDSESQHLPLYDPDDCERFPTLDVCDVCQRGRRKARHGYRQVPTTVQAAPC